MHGQSKPVTVAIPCGDGERYIESSIRSVLAQTYGNLEVFVFDQLSKDRTLEIARGIDDPRLTVTRNREFLTIGANWNQGFRHGTGPYVIVHHQDDLMAPDSIERKVAFLERHPAAGFVYSRVGIIDERGGACPGQGDFFSNDLFDSDRLLESMPFFMALLLNKNLICCPSVLFRREAALAVGGFNEEMPFTLDWEMWLRMVAAYPAGYVDSVTTYYRIHPGMDSKKHLDRNAWHACNARRTAIERSAALLNRWRTTDVLQEMVSIVRQIEERSGDSRGLGSVAPAGPDGAEPCDGDPLIRELIGGIRQPRDRVARLCREVLRLDRERAALDRELGGIRETATFRLGRVMMAPVRLARAFGARVRRG